jgi:hypothetical protein
MWDAKCHQDQLAPGSVTGSGGAGDAAQDPGDALGTKAGDGFHAVWGVAQLTHTHTHTHIYITHI